MKFLYEPSMCLSDLVETCARLKSKDLMGLLFDIAPDDD